MLRGDPSSPRRLAAAIMACCLALAAGGAAFAPIARAAGNPIVSENQQPGSSNWLHGPLVADDVNGQIKGYWSAASAKQGDSVTLYVSVNPAQPYTLDVYRLGWYQGLGGRLRLHLDLNGTQQAACVPDADTGLIACNWSPSYTLTVPADWTSGVYLGLLTNAAGYENYVIFVVRDDRPAAFLYQQSIMTDQAYNDYPNDHVSGKSLYTYNSYGANTVSGETRAVKVSFDRPYADYGFMQIDEIEFIRWIERSGYDVTYATDVDTHANGAMLLDHKGVLDVGHDEYWSIEIRNAFEYARDHGVNLAFFAADTASVQVRFESSAAGAANRVIVCYKNAAIDPVQGPTTTVAFRNPPVNRPEQDLRGVISGAMLQPQQPNADYVVTNSSHWIYANTGFKDGDTVSGIVGYEMDRYRSQYPPPSSANWTLLSHSPFIDYQANPDYANSSIYQAPSGAWVFSSGTISWSWALDGFWHQKADARIQQTTANLLGAFLNGPPPTAQRLSLVAPSSATSGSAFAVTVSAVDGQGNTVTSYSGTVHFTSSDTASGVKLPPDSTLTNGRGTFSVTLVTAGSQTVSVTDAANSLSGTANVQVSAPSSGIAFRAATQNDQVGPAPSLVLTVPAGVTNGDALYAAVIYEDGATATDPAGWTLVGEAVNANNDRTRLLRRIAASEPASYTWTFTGLNHVGGAMVAYSGVDQTTPEDTAAATQVGSTATPTSPSRTTVSQNTVLLSIFGSAGWAGTSSTGPAGMNVRATFGANNTFGFADQPIASPSATGARGWTSNAATPWAALAVALRPVGGGPAPAQSLHVTAPAAVTVAAVDGQGNPATSYNGTVHFRSSDASATLPADATLTAGQGTFSVTLVATGPQSITATDTVTASITGSATATVNAAAMSLDVATPATATAGQAFNVTVTATDGNGNVVTTYSGTVHFATSDQSAAVVLPPDSTLRSGRATFSVTLATAGSQSLTVTDGQITTVRTLTVNAAPATRLRLATTATPTAGTSFSFTVTAQDQFGNTDTAYAGTVHFTSSDASSGVVLPPDATLTSGQGTLSATLIKAGSQTITGADTTKSSLAGTLTVSVQPASAASLTLSAPSSARSGSAFTVTVTLKDAFGNVATGYRGTVHFTTSDALPTVVLPANYTFTAADAGTHAFSVTLWTVGTQTVTARDTVNGALTDTRSVTVGLL